MSARRCRGVRVLNGHGEALCFFQYLLAAVGGCAVSPALPEALLGCVGLTVVVCARWCPTLPHPGGCSTIGAGWLSFRVRDGSGRVPAAVTTETSGGNHTLPWSVLVGWWLCVYGVVRVWAPAPPPCFLWGVGVGWSWTV